MVVKALIDVIGVEKNSSVSEGASLPEGISTIIDGEEEGRRSIPMRRRKKEVGKKRFMAGKVYAKR